MPATPSLTPQAVTLNRRGVDLTDAGKYAEALAAFGKALELSPGSPGILFNRAEAARLSGDFAGARADLEAALAAEPASADTMHALGLIAYDTDEYSGAVIDKLTGERKGEKSAAAHRVSIVPQR